MISPLLSYANGQLEAQRAAAELEERLRAAAAALEAKQFGAALDAVRLALELEPANERARTLRDSIRSAKLADEEQQSIARQAEACRRLEASGRAHEALRQIQELAARYPNDQTVVIAQQELASRMRALEQRRSEQWRENRQRVDQLLADGSVEAALETARDLAGKFPMIRTTGNCSSERQRPQRKNRSSVRCIPSWSRRRSLQRMGNGALRPRSSTVRWRIRPGSQALREAAERLQTRGAVEAEVQAVERLLAEHDLDGAISAAKQSMSRHPGEARFSTLLERARERREFEDLLQYAHRALVLGDLEEAGNLVANARRRFGAHDLIRDLEARLERAQGRDRDLVAARQAVKDRNFDAAEKIAGRLLTSTPMTMPPLSCEPKSATRGGGRAGGGVVSGSEERSMSFSGNSPMTRRSESSKPRSRKRATIRNCGRICGASSTVAMKPDGRPARRSLRNRTGSFGRETTTGASVNSRQHSPSSVKTPGC